MPAAGMSGLSWKARQRIVSPGCGRSASARSSRRMPMKHQGQMVSEKMSIRMTGPFQVRPQHGP